MMLLLPFLSIFLLSVSSYEHDESDFQGAVFEGAPRFKSAVKLDHTVYLGDRVRLRCGAIGQPTPNVFWFRNRERILEEHKPESSRIDEDHHHMYINIKRIEAQDQGDWSCLVGNRHGNISRNFKLDIIDLCDQYLAPEIPAAYVLLECVCFWKFTNEILRKDINYTIASEARCRPYEHRIKYHARKPFAALPCLNPPCPQLSETSIESSEDTEDEEKSATEARRVPSTTQFPLMSSPNPPLAEGHVMASVSSGGRETTRRQIDELPQGDDPEAVRRAVERAVEDVSYSPAPQMIHPQSQHHPSQQMSVSEPPVLHFGASRQHDLQTPSSVSNHVNIVVRDDIVVQDSVREHSRTVDEQHATTHRREKLPEMRQPLQPMRVAQPKEEDEFEKTRMHAKSSTARSTTTRPTVLEDDMEDDESYEIEEPVRRNQHPKIKLDKANRAKLAPERDRIMDDPKKRVPPYFVEELEDFKSIVSPAGRTIKMSCRAGGVPSPMYIWSKDDVLIIASTSTRSTGAEYKMRDYYLELEDVTESDQGEYRCAVFNTKGEIHRRYNVSVLSRMRSPPIIVPNILMNQTVNVNDTATFTCRVISDLIPHIIWLKIEQTSEGNYHYYNETAKQYLFNYTETDSMPNAHVVASGQESTLELRDVQKKDQGLYACVTGNSMGKVMANASLSVNEFMAVNILTGVEKQPTNWGSYWLIGIALFFTLVLLALITAAILMLLQQKQLKKAPHKRRLMIVARKRDKSDDPEIYVGDLPSSYAVQIIEKDAHGHELKKRPRLNSEHTSFDDFEVETDPEWEIDRERLRLLEQLGEGAFGVVWRGVYTKKFDNGNSQDTPVAVKRLKENAHQKELVDLFSEAQMFKIIGRHENVLGLIGCCTGAGPLFVVLELCEHGNLRDFLRAHRPKEEKDGHFMLPPAPEDTEYLQPKKKVYECVIKDLTQRHLVEWAWQVAKGMKYMSSLKIIHRDLAARNVLVTGNFIMKISDFGLSRDVYSANYYRRKGNGRLPIKWMALEALDSHVYTVESDVWSFGILLWEIMTLGGTPYPTIAMPQLYSCLKDGYRMECPHNCPDEIYNLMVCCWQETIENRPSFDTIVDYFDWLLTESQRAEQSTDEGTATHETTIDSETDKGDDFSDSSDGTMETDANGTQRRVSRKSNMRPLSAPVLFPSEPAHEICDDDDDDCGWVPGSPAPPIQSFVRPSTSSIRASNSTRSPPPPPISLRTAPKRGGDKLSDEQEALIDHRERGEGPDSAIGSPSALDSSSYYPSIEHHGSSTIYSNGPRTEYANLQQTQRPSIFQPRKPEPPSRFNFNNVTLKYNPNDKAATISGEGSSNLGFVPSPVTIRTNNSASCYSIMSQSSGRGGSSAASSAEGLGGISEFCQVTYDRPPLTRHVSSLDEKDSSHF